MLLLFARLLPGSLLARSTSLAVFILSLGFSLSGFGQLLPAWATVICANIVILSAGPILYSCFSAYCDERTATPDWSGWGMLALTIPAFYYWGLIEPNGACRSMLFSLAVVALHGRTALRLGRFALLRTGGISTRGMALLFAMLTIWMALRAVVLLVGKSSPPDLRGGNPTTWMTVFGYIIIMSLMSVCVMWMEVERLKEGQGGGARKLQLFGILRLLAEQAAPALERRLRSHCLCGQHAGNRLREHQRDGENPADPLRRTDQ